MCYKIGQRVRVNCPISECDGWEGVVASNLTEACCNDGYYIGHEIHFPNEEYMAQCVRDEEFPCFEPRELIPIDDNYDGQKLGEWELCPWKPSLPVTVNDTP